VGDQGGQLVSSSFWFSLSAHLYYSVVSVELDVERLRVNSRTQTPGLGISSKCVKSFFGESGP